MVRWLVVKTEGLWEGFGFQGEIGASSPHVQAVLACVIFFFFLMAILGLCCCVGLSLIVASRSYSPAVMCGLLIIVASLTVEHRIQGP